MKATTTADVLQDATRSAILGDPEVLNSGDHLKHSTSTIGDPVCTSTPTVATNDAASAGDTASLSSASPSVSASVSAVDSMDAPALPNGIAEMPVLPPNRPMRRCVSDVGLEPQVSVFPSLPDSYLEQLGLIYDPRTGNCGLGFSVRVLVAEGRGRAWQDLNMGNNEVTGDQDIENKFVAISLAMKTDRLTLEARYQKQKKLCDQAMRNVEQEANNLNAALHRLNYLCTDSESIDILTNIKEQANFLLKAVDYVSGNAETLGAVRQEARVSRAWDVAVSHSENVKLLLENARTDLEDTKRMLSENRQQRLDGEPITQSRIRTVAADRPGSKRRASIATIARPMTPTSPLHSRSLGDGPNRTRSALRMGPYFPRNSTNESTLTSLESSELAEIASSTSIDRKDSIPESASSRVDQSLDKEEENNSRLNHDDDDDDGNNFLKHDDDDAFSGDDEDTNDLPDVRDSSCLTEEPITVCQCHEMSPTLLWLRDKISTTWTTAECLLDNLQRPDMEQVVNTGRKFIVGVLLVAAACCIIQIFVPVNGTSINSHSFTSQDPWLQECGYMTPAT